MAGKTTWPVLSDVTNVVTVGDIVVLEHAGDHARLEIIECKAQGQNSARPNARARRQNDRATESAEYLQEGIIRLDAAPDGLDITPDGWGSREDDQVPRGQGILGIDEGGYTEQNTAAIQEVVRKSREEAGGVAELSFGPGDHTLAVRNRGSATFERLDAMMPTALPNGAMVVHTQRVRRPNALVAPVTAVPLAPDDAVDLLTGDLMLVRLVDMDRFNTTTVVEGRHLQIRLDNMDGPWPFTVNVDGADGRIGPSFLERCLFGFVPISTTVDEITSLVANSAKIGELSVEEFEAAAAASVDQATYRVVEMGSAS